VALAPSLNLALQDAAPPKRLVLGSGEHTYECHHDWLRPPSNILFGDTHGLCVDHEGFIYLAHTVHKGSVNTDAICVYDPAGTFVRSFGSMFARDGEAAFSIEQPWQSHGVGTELLERTLLSARNRGITSLQMLCLADNQRMQQLARKFEAGFRFDFGSVVGEVDPPRFTPLSLMREAMADSHGIASAVLEAQSRLFKPA